MNTDKWRPGPFQLDEKWQHVQSYFLTLFLLLLVDYALCCFWNTGYRKVWHEYGVLPFVAAAILLAVALNPLHRGLRRVARRIEFCKKQVVALAVLFLGLYYGIALFVDLRPASDFAEYWKAGRELADGLSVGEQFSVVGLLRSVYYTMPIHLLFGASLLSLRLVNATLILAAGALFFTFVRTALNRRVATIATFLFLIWPDTILAIPFSSHDIPTLFWFSCFLVSAQRLFSGLKKASFWRAAIWSLLFGATIGLLDVQRSYGPLLIAGIGVFCFVSALTENSRGAGRVKWFVCVLAFPVLVSTLVMKLTLSPLGERIVGVDKGGIVAVVTAIDVTGDGTYPAMNWWFHSGTYMSIPDELKPEYAYRKILSETLSSPADFLIYLQRRIRVLAHVNDYAYFWPLERYRTFRAIFNYGMSWLVGLMSIATASVIYKAKLSSFPTEIRFLFVLSACMFTSIWGLSEVAPHYDIFMTFLLSTFTAYAICGPYAIEPGESVSSYWSVSRLILATGSFVLLMFGASVLGSKSRLFFYNFAANAKPEVSKISGMEIEIRPRSILFSIDPESTENIESKSEVTFPIPPGKQRFTSARFLVTTKRKIEREFGGDDYVSHTASPAGKLSLTVLIDDEEVLRMPRTTADPPSFLEVRRPKESSAASITFRLVTEDNKELSDGPFLRLDLLDFQLKTVSAPVL